MQELSKKEIRKRQLEILDIFVDTCNRCKLHYFLCGGTLLGAVRHRGFIPWDDDIDVFMPRPDYEKLQSILFPSPFEIHSLKNKKGHKPFLKLVDNTTEASEKNSRQKTALWIDIFAIDSLFENDFLNAMHYRLTHFLRKGVYFGFRPRTGLVGKFFLPILKVVKISPEKVNDFFSLLIDKISKIRPYEKGRYLGGINWGYGPNERLPREYLEKATPLEFEGKFYNAPIGYRQYLENLYGDYMTLPPKEKQKDHGLRVWVNREE